MYAILFMVYCNQMPVDLPTRAAVVINKLTLLADLCEIVDLTWEQFMSRNRSVEFLDRKHIVVALFKKHTGYSLKDTGKHCGGYDHTTVIHICRKVNDLCETDAQFRAIVSKYEDELFRINSN
jgi:chromosomal replication initiator protein